MRYEDLRELVLEEPDKISKEDIEQAGKAYEALMEFCEKLEAIAEYYADKELQKIIKKTREMR